MSSSHHQSPSFPSCFRPSATTDNHHEPPPLPPPLPGKPNLTTCIYHTQIGLFSLTWCRTFAGHSLHLNLHPSAAGAQYSSPLSLPNSLSLSLLHFHLRIKPFFFWKKQGSKKLTAAGIPNVRIFWDLSKAKFGSGPEPESGFFIAVMVDGEITLLIGDSTKQACSRIKAQQNTVKTQALVSRKEHVFGNRVYTTKAKIGGKIRQISIDCGVNEDGKLCFSVDKNRVLQIEKLKWKFRGNEKIEVDGVPIQISWDVHNWLFDQDSAAGGHAVFMFKFENSGSDFRQEEERHFGDNKKIDLLWQQNSGNLGTEWNKRKKSGFLKSARSSSPSSISMSSWSSTGSSSVMEWASTEETELSAPTGFSLLVYAWKK